MPARKAPSAIDTPNTKAAPVATARARASTVKVNSSLDRRRATATSIRGTNRAPARNTTATSAASLPIARRTAKARLRPPPAVPAIAGMTTSTTTVSRSSTMSQPTATWPDGESSKP
jgi:hypothetical protein